MATKQYLDYAGVQKLVELVKGAIASGDESQLSAAKAYADSLAVNYDAAGTAQTLVNALSDGQVKTNKEAIAKLDGADTVEGSIKAQLKALKEALEQEIEDSEYDDTALADRVTVNEGAIQTITGSGEGSIAKAVSDAKTEINGTIGSLTALSTEAKGSLVLAINELVSSLSAMDSAKADKATTLAGYGITNAYTKTEVDDLIDDAIEEATYDDTALATRVGVNETAIATLNGTGAGSVKKAIDDAINKFATDVTDNDTVDSFKELVDWVATHGSEAATMAGNIAINATAIETLDAKVGTLPAGTDAKSVVEYVDKKVGAVDFSDAIATAKSEAIAAAATDATTKANTALADAKKYTDDELVDVNTDLTQAKTDIEALQTSLAEGGATALAIADAKAAGTTAQAQVTALTNGAVKTNADDIDALEGRMITAEGDIASLKEKVGDGFTRITEAEIVAIFNSATV